jgi:hypothetical protein
MGPRRAAMAFACCLLSAILCSCSEERCAPLYAAAHDICTHAASETLYARLSEAAADCLNAYDTAHAELRASRQNLLSNSAGYGVRSQLASLLAQQMERRTRDGGASRPVSNLLFVEGLECSVRAIEESSVARSYRPIKHVPVVTRAGTLSKSAAVSVLVAAGLTMVWYIRRRLRPAPRQTAMANCRRVEARRATRFRTGKLVCNAASESETFCLIVNRSERGARVRLEGDLPRAAAYKFTDDAERKDYRARIAWRRGDLLGLRLYEQGSVVSLSELGTRVRLALRTRRKNSA